MVVVQAKLAEEAQERFRKEFGTIFPGTQLKILKHEDLSFINADAAGDTGIGTTTE